MSGGPTSHRGDDGGFTVPALFWWLLGGIYVVGSALTSYGAPCGRWVNRIFHFPMWLETDPGGWYMASAHELLTSPAPLYAGHPGIPLQLLLYGVQRIGFWAWGHDGMSFTEITARHIHHVFFASKVLVSLLHALSFYALFRFSRVLLRREGPALFAALGYATSLPVLYFLTRVSVEPLMVLLFLATWLSLWACEEARKKPGRVAALAAGAGAAAMSGLFTKMHILGLLPLFSLLYLLLGPRAPRGRAGVAGVVAHLSSSALFFALYDRFVSWPHFFAYWGRAVGGVSPTSSPTIASLLQETASGLTSEVAWGSALGLDRSGIFFLCELAFLLLAGAGIILVVRRRPDDGTRLLWVGVFAAFTVLAWGYRAAVHGELEGFHYLFIAMAVLAVFFGVAVDWAQARLSMAPSFRGQVTVGLVSVVLVHSLSIIAVLTSRLQDLLVFAPVRPYYEALPALSQGHRVGFVSAPGAPLDPRLFAVTDAQAPTGLHSSLREELDRLPLLIPDRGESTDALVSRLKEARIERVLDTLRPAATPQARSPEEWGLVVDR